MLISEKCGSHTETDNRIKQDRIRVGLQYLTGITSPLFQEQQVSSNDEPYIGNEVDRCP